MLAWGLFLSTLGCLAAGLVVALVLVRPLTVGVLTEGALAALLYWGCELLARTSTRRKRMWVNMRTAHYPA